MVADFTLTMADTPEQVGLSAKRLQRIRAVFDADVERGRIPGAVVLIARRGRVALFEAMGFEKENDPSRPMRRDSVFRLAALSRPIVCAGALMLMEEGRLALSDPVERYLPEFGNMQVGVEQFDAATGERRLVLEPVRRAMTVHDLFRHTSGLTYGPFGDSLVQRMYRSRELLDSQQTNAEMALKLASLPLQCHPGTAFEYGMSTDVLGRIIEVVSGTDLNRFITERVARPLGMHATGFHLARSGAAGLALPRQDPAGPKGVLSDYDTANPPKWFSGGAGLLSTANDYARFCQMLLNGGVLDGTRQLSSKSVKWMLTDHLPTGLDYGSSTRGLGINAPLPEFGQGYGLGVGVRKAEGLCPVPGSVGDFYWGGALGTYFWADPAEQLVAILMLQENDVAIRTGYRSFLRNVVYGALED
ncbi:serine hydrolase domain-containing protein [Cupriavidus sp. BIS7]|uniref:serine hydrolase domain-containing protein n=1 Tax=Cupriavidus sp. BIS7 TaxID=1217718 RepID=UPI0002E379B8|nr:serine hydrolase domain-containing protein [Cupriavidus sp. BIS7]